MTVCGVDFDRDIAVDTLQSDLGKCYSSMPCMEGVTQTLLVTNLSLSFSYLSNLRKKKDQEKVRELSCYPRPLSSLFWQRCGSTLSLSLCSHCQEGKRQTTSHQERRPYRHQTGNPSLHKRPRLPARPSSFSHHQDPEPTYSQGWACHHSKGRTNYHSDKNYSICSFNKGCWRWSIVPTRQC